MKRPYTYPHKSRKAMTAYLLDNGGYGGWNHPCRRWSPFSWNVKVHGLDTTGAVNNGYVIDKKFDARWEAYIRANELEVWERAVEDAAWHYTGGEYTTYPGDDQGDWEFVFGGRSGGHLILSKWTKYDVDFLKQFDGEEDFEGWLNELEFKKLRELYRAIRCMDGDFTRENARINLEHAINFIRHQWEEDHQKELEDEEEVTQMSEEVNCV